MRFALRSLGHAFCVAPFLASGFRYRKSSETVDSSSKLIAGVPVLDYHLAFQGKDGSSKDEVLAIQEEEWLVVVKDGTSDAAIDELCGRVKRGCKLIGHPQSGGVPFLEFRGTEAELETMLLSANGIVELAEPDLNADYSHFLERDVQAATSLWGLQRIAVPERTHTGKGVYIYVFDTGVRTTHTQFGNRASPAWDITSMSAVECHGDLNCAVDKVGHGTHCAGSAAGGTYGVAPDAWVRSVKVLSEYGYNPWSWIYAGMDWVQTKGERPAVASMSLGAPEKQDGLMGKALDAAFNSGVTVVVAAGNDVRDACRQQPANLPAAITVGSIDVQNKISTFSNFGQCVDIWAPGSDITSAWIGSDTDSKSLGGTSMACPHVSGAAALILEQDPALSPQEVTEVLLSNTLDNVVTGLTRSDFNKLLYVGGGPRPPTPAPSPRDPPTPAPTPPPACKSGSVGPDRDGDCRCEYGSYCYRGTSKGCPYSSAGRTSNTFYLVVCAECACKRR